MPVTESPTAVAVQNYTQLNDPGLNFYFHHNVNNVHQAVQLYLIKFYFGILFFYFAFYLSRFFLVFIVVVVVVLLEKVRLINFYSQKWYT